MPCNIGYKSYATVVIPESEPQTFKTKTEAPKIDAELLAKLGSEDPEFLEWAGELDTKPLMEEALKRTLSKINSRGIKFTVNAKGMLEAKGSYLNDREKKSLEKTTSEVSGRWQFEILGIVAELLNYTVTITQKSEELILEAEEEGRSHPCDYIKITKNGEGATLTFEHFKSRGALQVETAKFLVLAHKLGIKIAVGESVISEGDPFPSEVRHIHGHHHSHDHDHED